MNNLNADIIWKNPKQKFLQLPYVISFARTGTHWLNTMLELYFERNRVIPNFQGTITFVNKLNEGFMWYSSHDQELDLQPPENKLGTLYLYRDPVDTLHSLIQAHTIQPDHDEKELSQQELLEKWSKRYHKHLKKWLLNKEYNVRTFITYENLKKDTVLTLKKAVEHFNVKFDDEKGWEVASQVTKERVHQRGTNVMSAYFGSRYLSNEYKNKRMAFRKQNEKFIYSTVITAELKPWFQEYDR